MTNARVSKFGRKAANEGALKAVNAMAPAIEAALGNGEINRKRIDGLESVLRRDLRGRLRWLFSGK